MVYSTPTLVQYEIRAALSFSTSTIPTLATVTTWIDEISNEVSAIATREFDKQQYTSTIDYKGSEVIPLQNSPIVSVDCLLYSTSFLGSSDYNLASTAVKGTDYDFYDNYGSLIILPNGKQKFKLGRKTLEVVYTAGYETIPSDIQHLTTKMVAHRVLSTLIQQNVNERNDGGETSVGSIRIVEPSSYGVNSFIKLKDEIDSLKQNVIGKFTIGRYNGG